MRIFNYSNWMLFQNEKTPLPVPIQISNERCQWSREFVCWDGLSLLTSLQIRQKHVWILQANFRLQRGLLSRSTLIRGIARSRQEDHHLQTSRHFSSSSMTRSGDTSWGECERGFVWRLHSLRSFAFEIFASIFPRSSPSGLWSVWGETIR